MKTTKKPTKLTLKTHIKAGPNRRKFDHIGNLELPPSNDLTLP